MLTTAATMAAAIMMSPAFALAQDTGSTDSGSLVTPGDLGLGQIRQNAGFGKKTIYETIGTIIRVALTTLGIIAIILVIYGGFKWMTAGGSEENVGDAKKILYSGAIGLVIILSAYALTNFILGTLLTATGATGFSGL